MLCRGRFRGAVRPPFIEAPRKHLLCGLGWVFRGAVRPPFIEALCFDHACTVNGGFGGQSAPPSLKRQESTCFVG